VYDRDRKVPAHINIYLNNQEIHDLDGVATKVSDGDQVAVIPALAGGSNRADGGDR
jgi:molybdopterin converting factor small subunit